MTSALNCLLIIPRSSSIPSTCCESESIPAWTTGFEIDRNSSVLTLSNRLHIPITLFLDYNHLYIISQLALSPALPTLLTPRALQVGKLDASTAWWIAIAIYALSTVIWLVGIVAVREFYGGYLKIWRFGLGKRQVDLKEVYSNTAAFDRACLRSFAHFSFL